jgi:Carboxypeptidase regulatory-like domain
MRLGLSVAIVLHAAALVQAQPARAPQFGATISGHLADPAGRPLANWQVKAGQWQYHLGHKEFHLLPKATATTSANGVFTISQLDSGEHYLRAENPAAWSRNLVPNLQFGGTSGPDYPTTYYPGVTDIVSAKSITTEAGQRISSIDFRVQPAQGFHVRGKVTGAPGGPWLSMKPEPVLVPEDSRRVSPKPDGSFDLDQVLPGKYAISGFYQEVTAYTVVEVKNADVDNVMVQMLPCPKIRGTVRIDGHPSTASFPLAALTQAMSFGVQVEKDGTFISRCIEPGRYSLPIELARDGYIKSIRLDGKDVTHDPLDFTSRADRLLDIELGSQAGVIRGIVRDASGRLLPGVTVTAWDSSSDFNLSAISDKTGNFEIGHLAPGSYRVAAWDRLHSQPQGWGVQTLREFRDEFAGTASPIVVKPGEQATLDPVMVSSQTIVAAARRLHLNAPMMPDEQEAAIREAAKSPYTLAKLIQANPHIDASTLATVLGIDDRNFEWPCSFVMSQCSVKVESVSNPELALVVIHNEMPGMDLYLRYAQKPDNLWQFTGEAGAGSRYQAPTHEIVRMWGKPFLKTDQDRSQHGSGIIDDVEEWFDLTDAKFAPVFSFSSEAGSRGFSMAVDTHGTSKAKLGQSSASQQIELRLKMHFLGPGFDVERVFLGIYQRPASGKFKLVNAYSDPQRLRAISVKEFEALADPMSDNEVNLLAYALPELRKIASGSDAEAREWLASVLEHSDDSPEKRELVQLLKKRQ